MADHAPPGPIRHRMSLRARAQMTSPYARSSQDRPVRKMRARKERPKQLKSHYKKLSAEKKQTIRPFKFLELPAELRLEIYKHILLVPARPIEDQARLMTRHHHPNRYRLLGITKARLVIRAGQFAMDTAQRQVLQLQIMQCCQQLCNEGRDYFWTQNKIDQHHDLDYLSSGHDFNSAWPQQGLHLPSIRVLRVVINSTDYMNATLRFDCSSIASLPNLQVLQVAFISRVRARVGEWHADGGSMHWIDSLVLGAVVHRIVQHTPSTVVLKWGLWNDALEDQSMGLDTSISIHSSILEKIMKSYEHERGRKVPLIIEEEVSS
ncbi:hypothetical protein FKW77_005983 [Venturia effusa]|uniref:Uncharacterized protein n=1 Tax=Venturia effusa TaxID=50376 RepID=A0A517LQ89_9PEZI|nr:hypothetical protein FKW77_005983 [Venturia effusa]